MEAANGPDGPKKAAPKNHAGSAFEPGKTWFWIVRWFKPDAITKTEQPDAPSSSSVVGLGRVDFGRTREGFVVWSGLPLVSLGQGQYTHDLAGRANASLDRAGNAPLPVATRRTVAAVGGQITPTTPTTPPTPELAMLPHPDREMLASAATTLHRIAQEAAGALGLLARAGIKPLE